MKLGDVLDVIQAAEGVPGLRRFFDEMCQASPELLAHLSAHGMLLTAPLDLDDKARQVFGRVPGLERQS